MRLDSAQFALTHSMKKSHLNRFEILLVLLPILLMLGAMTWIMKKLPQNEFKLSHALSDSRLIELMDKEKNKVSFEQVHINSSSRLLAFMSGVSTIIFVITMLSYSGYVAMLGGEIPDFSRLWTIVMGLGFGVVPYGFNRLSKKSPTGADVSSESGSAAAAKPGV